MNPTGTTTDPAAPGPRFDPTDPADLEQLAAHLLQRSGRLYTVPAPFEVPADAGDPATAWLTYPEDPAIQHVSPATRTAIRVSFPPGDSFRIFGFTASAGDPVKLRTIDRTGRFHMAGPATLAWVLSRLIDREIAGDPPDDTTAVRERAAREAFWGSRPSLYSAVVTALGESPDRPATGCTLAECIGVVLAMSSGEYARATLGDRK